MFFAMILFDRNEFDLKLLKREDNAKTHESKTRKKLSTIQANASIFVATQRCFVNCSRSARDCAKLFVATEMHSTLLGTLGYTIGYIPNLLTDI